MKKDRNFGSPYPVYPQMGMPYPNMAMPGMMPNMGPNMGMPGMMPTTITSDLIGSCPNSQNSNCNQQIGSLEQRVSTLEKKVTTLENLYNSGSYSNNYNSSNYQML